MTPPKTPKNAVTLLELGVATAILAAILAIALSLLASANRSVGTSMQLTGAAIEANKTDGLLSSELQDAGPMTLLGASVSPTGAFTAVQYRRLVAVDAATSPPAPVFGPLREIRFTFDKLEAGFSGSGNGLDGDRDGRIDEGELLLFVDDDGDGSFSSNERKASLGTHISSDDLSFAFPSGQPTPQPTDLRLSVRFTVLLPRGVTGTADGTTGETRTLLIPLRNK